MSDDVNKILEQGNLSELSVIDKGFHYIRKLVTNYAKTKDLISINYKTDLKSGVRLDPVHHFTNDGLLDNTVYLFEDKPVLNVSEIYSYSKTDMENKDMPLSKKGIYSRTKIWRYYLEDGTLDESNDEGTYKEKKKLYKTDIESLTIGSRRRHNIQIILSQRAGALLVILGVFQESKEVQDAMRNISATYSANFQEYEKYGTELIFDDILNDTTYSWLDTYVPTDIDLNNMVIAGHINEQTKAIIQGTFNTYDLTNIQGMTIRNYFVEKLKGNMK